MRPPGKYDALRQAAEQQAQEARAAPSQPEAAGEMDSAQVEPTRPTRHPSTSASFDVEGRPQVPVKVTYNLAEIADAAKAREDAAIQAKAQEKGKGGNER